MIQNLVYYFFYFTSKLSHFDSQLHHIPLFDISHLITYFVPRYWYMDDSCLEFCREHTHIIFFIRNIFNSFSHHTGDIHFYIKSHTYISEYGFYAYDDYIFSRIILYFIGALLASSIFIFIGMLIKKIFTYLLGRELKISSHITNNLPIYAIYFRIIPVFGFLSSIFIGISNNKIADKLFYVFIGQLFVLLANFFVFPFYYKNLFTVELGDKSDFLLIEVQDIMSVNFILLFLFMTLIYVVYKKNYKQEEK